MLKFRKTLAMLLAMAILAMGVPFGIAEETESAEVIVEQIEEPTVAPTAEPAPEPDPTAEPAEEPESEPVVEETETPAEAETPEVEAEQEPVEEFVIADGVLKLYNGTDSKVVIPDDVIEIAARAFAGNVDIRTVVIPDGLEVIGDEAFIDCAELTKITVPASVTDIGDDAFKNCEKLTVWVYADTPAHAYCEAQLEGKWSLIDAEESVAPAKVAPATAPELVTKGLKLEGKDVIIIGGYTDMKVYDANGAKLNNKNLTWLVSNSAIIGDTDGGVAATVNSSGRVTGKVLGRAFVTAVTKDGVYGSTMITVLYPPKTVTLKVNGEALPNNPTIILKEIGNSVTLWADVDPDNADSTVTWSNSNSKQVKLETDGNYATITGLAETSGVTITVKTVNGKSAKVKIKVEDPYKPTAVALDKTGTVTLNMDEELRLTPSLKPENAKAEYSWKSSSTKVAEVVGGVVTPKGEGTATITVTAVRGATKKTASVKVKVVDRYKPTGVAIDPSGTVEIDVGETMTFGYILKPAESRVDSVVWKSSSDKIARVEDELVTGVAEGTATVTVTITRGAVKKSASCKVKVVDPKKPTSVALEQTGTVELAMGAEPLVLKPILKPETADAEYSWKSSSTKIAEVNKEGAVTAKGEGTATITVTAKRGKIVKTASVKVKVYDPYKPTAVTLNQTGTVALEMDGEPLVLVASLKPETAKADSITWKSSSTQIAEVDDKGVVTAKGEGTATITVTAKRGKIVKTASVKVKVYDPKKLTAVALEQTGTVELAMGAEPLVLKPILKPATAEADSLTWKSSSTKIATVDDKGAVTAVSEGTATITVTATQGKLKKTASVKVKVYDPYKPTAVALEQTGTVALEMDGEPLKLVASLKPETAKADSITWKSSSTQIAEVDKEGVVTAKGEGTATITVTAKRGKIVKTASVKVKVTDPYKPTAVALEQTGTVKLDMGKTLKLTPSLKPENARAEYSWKSSSTKIAEVDEEGVVTAKSEGTATITVTATRGKVKKTASVKVTVVDPYKPTKVTLDREGTVTLYLDQELQLNAKLTPDNATCNLTWTSSSTKIATVDQNGLVKPVKEGTVTITVKTHNGLTDTVKVKVSRRPAPTSVELDQSGTVSLTLGETMELYATVLPEEAEAILTWISSDPSVATVDADGLVTALKDGTTTISVKTQNGKTASVEVKVVDPSIPTSIALEESGTQTLDIDKTLTLHAVVKPVTAEYSLTWISSDTGIAVVDENGVVTPVKDGTVTITVKTDNGLSASITVKVVDPYLPTSIELDQEGPVTLYIGRAALRLKATMQPEIARSDLSWTSSDDEVATVDETGLVTPVKEGTATITVTTRNGKTDSIVVNVIDPATLLPVITLQPVSQTVLPGEKVTFKVEATGANLRYNWLVRTSDSAEFVLCEGENAAELTIEAALAMNGNEYRVVIFNEIEDSVASEIATLTVVEEVEIDAVKYHLLEDGTLAVSGYTGNASELVINETIRGFTITEIGEEAFMGNDKLTSISLPDTITVIKARAFKNCSNLSEMD